MDTGRGLLNIPSAVVDTAGDVIEGVSQMGENIMDAVSDAGTDLTGALEGDLLDPTLEPKPDLIDFNANIGAFIGDISKGDPVSFATYTRGIADVARNTKKFAKTIKKVNAIADADPNDPAAMKTAQDSASHEFLKVAKKAWTDIQKSAKMFRSAVASKKGKVSFGKKKASLADDVDYVALWESSSATIGGARDRQGQYGRTGNRYKSGVQAPKNSAAAFYLGLPLTLQTIEVLDSLGIVTPFGAIVFRPFQSFNMGSAVVMKAGNDTGFTCVGNSDFQLVLVA